MVPQTWLPDEGEVKRGVICRTMETGRSVVTVSFMRESPCFNSTAPGLSVRMRAKPVVCPARNSGSRRTSMIPGRDASSSVVVRPLAGASSCSGIITLSPSRYSHESVRKRAGAADNAAGNRRKRKNKGRFSRMNHGSTPQIRSGREWFFTYHAGCGGRFSFLEKHSATATVTRVPIMIRQVKAMTGIQSGFL